MGTDRRALSLVQSQEGGTCISEHNGKINRLPARAWQSDLDRDWMLTQRQLLIRSCLTASVRYERSWPVLARLWAALAC